MPSSPNAAFFSRVPSDLSSRLLFSFPWCWHDNKSLRREITLSCDTGNSAEEIIVVCSFSHFLGDFSAPCLSSRCARKRSTSLSKKQRDWIASSDTFTLGTYAEGQYGGADASNRGGNPGFVRALDERTIVFPDYKVWVGMRFS